MPLRDGHTHDTASDDAMYFSSPADVVSTAGSGIPLATALVGTMHSMASTRLALAYTAGAECVGNTFGPGVLYFTPVV